MPITDFLRYLQFEKRYSPLTVKAYHDDMDHFYRFAESKEKRFVPSEEDFRIIREWMVCLMEEKLSPRSINRKISSLRSFYRYLLREGKITSSPLNRIKSLKTPKNLPEFLNSGQMDQLLDEVDFGEKFDGVRNRLIIEILYVTGLRRAELIGLSLSGLNLADRTIRVLGKRNKERIIPILPELAEDLALYLEARKEIRIQPDHGKVFVTGKGFPIYPSLVYRVVRAYLAKVTTAGKRSPHILRHTFATSLLNNGADLNAIRELLGHTSLAATQVYTHNSFEKLKKVYQQAHPRA